MKFAKRVCCFVGVCFCVRGCNSSPGSFFVRPSHPEMIYLVKTSKVQQPAWFIFPSVITYVNITRDDMTRPAACTITRCLLKWYLPTIQEHRMAQQRCCCWCEDKGSVSRAHVCLSNEGRARPSDFCLVETRSKLRRWNSRDGLQESNSLATAELEALYCFRHKM